MGTGNKDSAVQFQIGGIQITVSGAALSEHLQLGIVAGGAFIVYLLPTSMKSMT